MAHFVGEHPRQFRFAVGQRQQAAGDVDVAARQGERVDILAVDDGEGIAQVRDLGVLGQRLSDAIDVGGKLRIVVGAAHLLHELRMLLGTDPQFVLPAT